MNTEKELESIIKEGKRLKAERERDMNFTEKHIEEMMSSVDALCFVVYGSLLGLVINLIANIIHDYFSKYTYEYYFLVILAFLISLYLLLNFVIQKLNKVLTRDKLMKEMIEGKEDPNDYIKSLENLQKRLENLKINNAKNDSDQI